MNCRHVKTNYKKKHKQLESMIERNKIFDIHYLPDKNQSVLDYIVQSDTYKLIRFKYQRTHTFRNDYHKNSFNEFR